MPVHTSLATLTLDAIDALASDDYKVAASQVFFTVRPMSWATSACRSWIS
jgi:hypothetical protein